MKSQIKKAFVMLVVICLISGLTACKKEEKKKNSKYIGTWNLEYASMGEKLITPDELNMSMSIILDEKGSATINLIENESTNNSIGKWEETENGIRILEADGEMEVFRMAEIEGRLQTEQDSIVLIFAKQE